MPLITPKQARAFLERWKIVGRAEIDALRESSMETRLRQLSALVASRPLFGLDPDRERGIQQVRERWARIRKAADV
jgi:hypothetical protein